MGAGPISRTERDSKMEQRVFIGHLVDSREVSAQLDQAWQRVMEMLPDGSLHVRRKRPHITIKYLGTWQQTDHAQRRAIAQMSEDLERMALKVKPIAVRLGPMGAFPGVSWMAVAEREEGDDALNDLRKRVARVTDRALLQQRATRATDERPFRPHITVGKFPESETPAVIERTEGMTTSQQPEFAIDNIQLLASQGSDDQGASYIVLTPPIRLRGE